MVTAPNSYSDASKTRHIADGIGYAPVSRNPQGPSSRDDDTLLQDIDRVLHQVLVQLNPGEAASMNSDADGDDGVPGMGGPAGAKHAGGGHRAEKRLLEMLETVMQMLQQTDAGKMGPNGGPSYRGDQDWDGNPSAGGEGSMGAGTTAMNIAGAAGVSGSGALSTAPQTSPLSAQESQQVGTQWKDNLMKDFGLTDEQAAGIVGNLWHESGGMNSGITQGGRIGPPNGNMADDNGNGYGIAQWGGSRKQGLIDYAQQNGLDPSSQAANYGYLKQELSGPYKGAIDAVKSTSDVASATAAFCNTFEKPTDPQMASRLAYAQQVA
jgi:hypothetical protein